MTDAFGEVSSHLYGQVAYHETWARPRVNPSMPTRDSDLIRRLRDVFLLDEATITRQLHPDFNRYFRDLLTNKAAFDTYLEEVRYLASAGHLSGHVLDLAAGFGVTAICLRALGADRVTCLDLIETKVAIARKLAELVRADSCSWLLCDAAAIPLEDHSVDGVLVKDAASHFRYPMKVYAEIARVLRPAGRLVVFDDRNALNRQVTRATQEVWEVSEAGSRDDLARLGLSVSFTQMRRDYIARRFPSLDERQIARIASETRGYTFRMLEYAVPLMIEGGSTDLERDAQCINPENEVVQERLIDPLQLVRQLARVGFEARVLPPASWDPVVWRRRRGTQRGLWSRRLASSMWWPTQRLWPFLIKRMAHFAVVAVKR